MDRKPVVLPVPTIAASTNVGVQLGPADDVISVNRKPAMVIPIDCPREKAPPDLRRKIITRAVGNLSDEVVRLLLSAVISLTPNSKLTDEEETFL